MAAFVLPFLQELHAEAEGDFKLVKQVKNVFKEKKVKNISSDAFGTKMGAVHVDAQQIAPHLSFPLPILLPVLLGGSVSAACLLRRLPPMPLLKLLPSLAVFPGPFRLRLISDAEVNRLEDEDIPLGRQNRRNDARLVRLEQDRAFALALQQDRERAAERQREEEARRRPQRREEARRRANQAVMEALLNLDNITASRLIRERMDEVARENSSTNSREIVFLSRRELRQLQNLLEVVQPRGQKRDVPEEGGQNKNKRRR